MTTMTLAKVFMTDMPRPVKYALYVTVFTWAAWGFKKVEPTFFPVVADFVITQSETIGNSKRISGVMTKKRDCEFVELIAYSGSHLVSLAFADRPSSSTGVISRVEGTQDWGWWVITPAVDTLTLYSRHNCATGRVLTRLFDGRI